MATVDRPTRGTHMPASTGTVRNAQFDPSNFKMDAYVLRTEVTAGSRFLNVLGSSEDRKPRAAKYPRWFKKRYHPVSKKVNSWIDLYVKVLEKDGVRLSVGPGPKGHPKCAAYRYHERTGREQECGNPVTDEWIDDRSGGNRRIGGHVKFTDRPGCYLIPLCDYHNNPKHTVNKSYHCRSTWAVKLYYGAEEEAASDYSLSFAEDDDDHDLQVDFITDKLATGFGI